MSSYTLDHSSSVMKESPADAKVLRVGSRGSILAVWQAQRVIELLQQGDKNCQAKIHTINTQGDRYQDGPLADIGGKGLFAKELDIALLNRDIDIAVHSLKDLETVLPEGIRIAVVLAREDPRDALIGMRLNDLGHGARVATCSVRRAAQIRYLRPDVRIVPIRGNVQTRLKKLSDGIADATLLSYAGLLRLDLQHRAAEIMSAETMLPAVGQGVIVVTAREDDRCWDDLLGWANCCHTEIGIIAEREMLRVLDGSCHTPIAGNAFIHEDTLHLRAMVLSPDGQQYQRHDLSVSIAEQPLPRALELGHQMGQYFIDHASDILRLSQQ